MSICNKKMGDKIGSVALCGSIILLCVGSSLAQCPNGIDQNFQFLVVAEDTPVGETVVSTTSTVYYSSTIIQNHPFTLLER